MKINKKEFHNLCLEYASGKYSTDTERAYLNYVSTFISYLIMRFNMNNNREDYMQDVFEYIIRTKMHEKVDNRKNAFNLYWTSISRHLWLLQKRERKKALVPISNLYIKHRETEQTDEDLGDNLMLKSLGFNLEDYVIEDEVYATDYSDISKVVASSDKQKRGRTKVKYWQDMYKLLREKKTMTEAELIRVIPLDKRQTLKDPEKSVLNNIRLLANKDGYKISVSDTGVNKVYMIVGV